MTKRVSNSGTYVAVVTRCVLCDAEITEYVPWRRRLNTVSDSPHKHRKRVVCADCFAREWAAMTGRTVGVPRPRRDRAS